MKPNNSLILKEQAENEAAPFFPNFEMPEIDKAKPKFHCTGDRLFRDRPDIYKAVVRLLAEPGVTIRTICQECHVTDDVVRSVKARENIPIAHEKKNILASITHGLRLASERVIEVMPKASPRDALVGVGILGEKMQLLGGDATMRIELGPKVDIHESFDRLNKELLKSYEKYKAHVAKSGDEEGARLLLKFRATKALADHSARNTGLNAENPCTKDIDAVEVASRSEGDGSGVVALQESIA